VARNAYALALLMVLALTGCSRLTGAKEAKEAEAKMAALRARTDSLRKARRMADSLAQVRFTTCADSVRTGMTKPPVATKVKKKKKQPVVAPPSEELIAAQVQAVCQREGGPSQTTVAAATAAPAQPAGRDSAKPAAAGSVKPPAPAATPAPSTSAATPAGSESVAPAIDQPAWADSVRRAKEMEMSRETFAYSGAARDPFNSLLDLAKSGPELADLQLVGIYQNIRLPSASVAVFREKNGGKRHKLRAGDQLGRSRLVQIRDRDVVFMIEDFGFERQETLSLRKQEDVIP
jgi:hypothetical protein